MNKQFLLKHQIPSRHIHLDFHTSEEIRVGHKFDAKDFQQILLDANVNSICIFAKCHHSWCYYPTKAGKVHPQLQIDLFGEQVNACKEANINVVGYITVGWSANDSLHEYPECVVRNREGEALSLGELNVADFTKKKEEEIGFYSWFFMCPSGRYAEHVKEITKEIITQYNIDGIFYDISNAQKDHMCYCKNCLEGMKEENINLDNISSVQAYNERKWQNFKEQCNEIIVKYRAKSSIFWNGSNSFLLEEDYLKYNTHQELEDLPTCWGGYNKLPFYSKAVRKKGYQALAMSGKFHKSWGEFGGFKHPKALKFEVAQMLSFGAKCSFGDQLHPYGKLEKATYDNIKIAFDYVKSMEEYAYNGQDIANVAILAKISSSNSQRGISSILLEEKILFNVIFFEDNFDDYKLLIIPSEQVVDDKTAQKLQIFATNGGKIIVFGRGILIKNEDKPIFDIFESIEENSYHFDYTYALYPVNKELPNAPFYNYISSPLKVKAKGEIELLTDTFDPLFNRTFEHYCGHANTPHGDKKSSSTGAFRSGNVLYIPQDFGKIYEEEGAFVHRKIVGNMLNYFMQEQLLSTNLGALGKVNLIEQKDKNRYCLHILYGIPTPKGDCQIIDDLSDVYDTEISLKLAKKIDSIKLLPQNITLNFIQKEGKVKFTINKFNCHCVVILNYSESIADF